MAKLNGVVLTAEAIEYNGVKYEKIDETAKVGDILRVDDSDVSWVTEGAYYEVDDVDSCDDPQIIDNDGDEFDGAKIDYTLFRKVSVPQTSTSQQYREVKRRAEEGERIKIVNATMAIGYSSGDEGVVLSVRGDDGLFAEINKRKRGIFHSEYVVLEPIAEQSDDIIEVDGVKYRKLPGAEPQAGGFILAKICKRDVTKGKIYEVIRISERGNPCFHDDVNDLNFLRKEDYEVVERIETSDDLQRQVSELQTKLAEAESKLATQKAEEEKAKDPRSAFAKGDKVRLISGGDKHPLCGYKNGEVYVVSDPLYIYGNKIEITGGEQRTGYALPSQLAKLSEQEIAEMNRLKVGEYAKVAVAMNGCSEVGNIVKITKDDRTGYPFETEHLDGQYAGWHYANSLVRATDEEVAEARRKLELSKFTVGDYVKVLVDTEDLDEGAVGKVTVVDNRDGEWPIKVELMDDSNYDWYKPEQLEKVSEEVAKWAAIGREIGQFKKGDLVIVESKGSDNGYVGKVEDLSRTLLGIRGLDGGYRGPRKADVKLITPVESVVNLKAAN